MILFLSDLLMKCGMVWTYRYTKGIPIEAQYLYKKAMEMYKLEKPESALKYLKQTIVIAPRYSKALVEMGNCLTQLGNLEEARDCYEQAIQINPELQYLLEKEADPQTKPEPFSVPKNHFSSKRSSE